MHTKKNPGEPVRAGSEPVQGAPVWTTIRAIEPKSSAHHGNARVPPKDRSCTARVDARVVRLRQHSGHKDVSENHDGVRYSKGTRERELYASQEPPHAG